MKICLVVVTHNRLAYTRKCLEALLADRKTDFDLVLWDNASTDETAEYLRDGIKDARVKEVVLHKENPGPTFALNRIWSKSKAELIGKVDNDCLVAPDWLTKLSEAHTEIEQLGAIACWHYREIDFNESVARWKIHQYGRHRIFRHPHVCGSGFLLKRSIYQKIGPCPEGSRSYGLTGYFHKVALGGYINGWYYPFVLQDHMDDPFSPHCAFKDDATMQAVGEVTYTMRTHAIKTYAERLKRREYVLRELHLGPWQPQFYLGWPGRIRRWLPFVDRFGRAVYTKFPAA